MSTGVLITSATLIDPEDGERTEGWLRTADGKIVERGSGPAPAVGDDVQVIDAAGASVIPGLIDAHVHLAVTSLNMGDVSSWTQAYAAARTFAEAKRMLHRGFTTVRDVGGADRGLVRALAEGLASGPRVVHAGHMISQTGGHGDLRSLDETHRCACDAVSGIAVIVDGVDAMRAAVREELRQGASFIKIAASGGVASPHDHISAVQYTEEELRAAVVEAENANTYVTVHAYHPRSMGQALRAGVTCIEHGNLLDEPTAQLMKEKDAWLVPTLITYELLASQGAASGLPAESIAKVSDVRDRGLAAYALAHQAGVKVAFGTDLLAEMGVAQPHEFALRAQVAPTADILREATVAGADLLGYAGQLGTLAPGAIADLLIVDGDPLEDITLLARPEQSLRHVIQRGVVAAP
ncbi:MAG: peptidase M38 [Microbacterium sp. 69-10]|uniref:metal-dependent hydrolase family protein n=1 Tax=Microbacterium sp. 69-10 TaxID=1895783 RepID=UPI00095FE1FC|nr:amidohydrolase family protein [Microbacterium sp. 69-10]OJU40698.1 MAG: peptidase M38 [Microbacterium sp. 69-10]